MARKSVSIKVVSTAKTDSLLASLPIELREKQLVKAVTKAAKVVEKEATRLAPKPGYPGDKAGKIALNTTIDVKKLILGEIVMAIVGPRYPMGAHGHLVEFGHAKVLWGKRTSERVEAKPFLRPAADTTQAEQERAIVQTLKFTLKAEWKRSG